MNPGYELKTDIDDEKSPDQEKIITPIEPTKNKISKAIVAGIFLIIAGILAIIFWTQFFTLDSTTLESIIDTSQFEQLNVELRPEQIISFLKTCAIIGVVISIFPILGGILALKKKLWGIALVGSIIGLFSLGMLFTSSGLSLISLILIIISREEFESNKK
jgi:hypothetical protein